MEKAKADKDATKLGRLERAWAAAQRSLATTIREATAPGWNCSHQPRAAVLAAKPLRRDTDGDAFTMRINGAAYSKRADAARALQGALLAVQSYQRDPVPLGEVGGLHLQASADSWLGQPRYVVSLVEVPRMHLLVEAGDVRQPNIGLVTRVENLPRRLERVLADVEMDAGKINREAEKARAGIVDAFPRAAEASEVRAKRDRLSAELATDSADKTGRETEHAPSPPAANGTTPLNRGAPR